MSTAVLSQPVRIKDNEADGCDSNAHIFFDEGNGQSPPASIGEVACAFGAAHARGEHQVTEAHGEQRHGEGYFVELGGDKLAERQS